MDLGSIRITPGWYHYLRTLNLITSSKIPFSNKVTFTGSRNMEKDISFRSHHSTYSTEFLESVGLCHLLNLWHFQPLYPHFFGHYTSLLSLWDINGKLIFLTLVLDDTDVIRDLGSIHCFSHAFSVFLDWIISIDLCSSSLLISSVIPILLLSSFCNLKEISVTVFNSKITIDWTLLHIYVSLLRLLFFHSPLPQVFAVAGWNICVRTALKSPR